MIYTALNALSNQRDQRVTQAQNLANQNVPGVNLFGNSEITQMFPVVTVDLLLFRNGYLGSLPVLECLDQNRIARTVEAGECKVVAVQSDLFCLPAQDRTPDKHIQNLATGHRIRTEMLERAGYGTKFTVNIRFMKNKSCSPGNNRGGIEGYLADLLLLLT